MKTGVLEVLMPKTGEDKKTAITVKIDRVRVSRVLAQERSFYHGQHLLTTSPTVRRVIELT